MAQRKTLNEAQIRLLRWVADGCPADVEIGEFFRISAAALRNRGLIDTTGKGARWSASITSAGRDYLSEVDSANPPVPRQANVSVTQQLVDDVIAAGGSLRVPRRRWWHQKDIIDYPQRARLAQIYGKVPEGQRLVVETLSDDELMLSMVEDDAAAERPQLIEVSVPGRVNRLHSAAADFRDDKERHEVSREQLPRAVRIVHAIATEAERRGWTFGVSRTSKNGYGHLDWTGTKDGHLQLLANGRDFRLHFQERGVHARGRYESDCSYRPGSDAYDKNGSGQLSLEIDPHRTWDRGGRQSRFSDRASWALESRISHLFLEIEERIIEADRADEDRRIAAEKAAEAARLAAEVREREWLEHQRRAEERLIESERASAFASQVADWRKAVRIREYCDAIARPFGGEAAAWISWARAYADRIDPLRALPTMPPAPEATGEALQPFMPTGWSAEGPDVRAPIQSSLPFVVNNAGSPSSGDKSLVSFWSLAQPNLAA